MVHVDQPVRPPRVLIVVASLQLRTTVRQCIDTQPAACHCVEAASGEEAELLCRAQTIELVLLDLHLPGISAFDTARRIKAMQPACQIVLLAEAFEAAWLSLDPERGASGSVCKDQLHDELELLLPMYLDRCRAESSDAAGGERSP